MRIGVVIPARDEAGSLPALLATLGPFFEAADPVIVVDDGSEDSTAERAREFGTRVIASGREGRGLAVHRGVEALARSVEVVLILHADMGVPEAARGAIESAFGAAPDLVGGALGHRIDDPRVVFRWIERGNRFRARTLRLPYGDQAQFFRVTGDVAFPRQERLEDLELSLRLRRAGSMAYLDVPVRIPPRHWAAGVLRTTVRNWGTVIRYLAGRESRG